MMIFDLQTYHTDILEPWTRCIKCWESLLVAEICKSFRNIVALVHVALHFFISYVKQKLSLT